jgi:hypothetical protein
LGLQGYARRNFAPLDDRSTSNETDGGQNTERKAHDIHYDKRIRWLASGIDQQVRLNHSQKRQAPRKLVRLGTAEPCWPRMLPGIFALVLWISTGNAPKNGIGCWGVGLP